jgi:[ribosomal protein S5]-alanine N-acetyltransferase
MESIQLRCPRSSDAARFYAILNNDNFRYFDVRPKTVEAERDWIRQCVKRRADHFQYDYAIIFKNRVVGGCGIKIDQHRKHIGEIGYFIDEAYWGKGIATQAVSLLEDIAWKELGITRIHVLMLPKNSASERVAKKAGYLKEGTMRKAISIRGAMHDCHLYAKVTQGKLYKS